MKLRKLLDDGEGLTELRMVGRTEPFVGDRLRVDDCSAGIADAFQADLVPIGGSGANGIGADGDFIARGEEVVRRLTDADMGFDADQDRLLSRRGFEALHERSASGAGESHFGVALLDKRFEPLVGAAHALGILDRCEARDIEDLSDSEEKLGSVDDLVRPVDGPEKAWLQIDDDQNGF